MLRTEPGKRHGVWLLKVTCLRVLKVTSCVDTVSSETSEHGCVFRAGGTRCQA